MRPERPKRTILQIISADNWWARYRVEKSRQYTMVELVAWALVEEIDEDGIVFKYVVGLCGPPPIDFCDDAESFEDYIHETPGVAHGDR